LLMFRILSSLSTWKMLRTASILAWIYKPLHFGMEELNSLSSVFFKHLRRLSMIITFVLKNNINNYPTIIKCVSINLCIESRQTYYQLSSLPVTFFW
jgi:hypothetical protein